MVRRGGEWRGWMWQAATRTRRGRIRRGQQEWFTAAPGWARDVAGVFVAVVVLFGVVFLLVQLWWFPYF